MSGSARVRTSVWKHVQTFSGEREVLDLLVERSCRSGLRFLGANPAMNGTVRTERRSSTERSKTEALHAAPEMKRQTYRSRSMSVRGLRRPQSGLVARVYQ